MASLTTRSLIFRIIALIIIDAFALNLVIGIGMGFSPLLGFAIFIGTLIINFVYLFDRFGPWRWTAPGLALMALMVVYPLVNTVLVSFTNYGDGHLGQKEQTLAAMRAASYKPENSVQYKVSFYSKTPKPTVASDVVLWLTAGDNSNSVASVDKGVVPVAEAEKTFGKFGELDGSGVPKSIGDANLVSLFQIVGNKALRDSLQVKSNSALLRVDDTARTVSEYLNRFEFSEKDGVLSAFDRQLNATWSEKLGAFTRVDEKGNEVDLNLPGGGGWPVSIGLNNFTKAITSENVRGPFLSVFVWTVVFALGSVFSCFALGLMFAIVLNAADVPLRGIFRSILIIPYALPAFISVLVWRGLLQPDGIITDFVRNLTGTQPQWFDNAVLAKIAILGVNLWLGYPYMMLITMGALQSIPSDLYEAAVIDGANYWAQLRRITLPLLLVAVGPLLIGSFAFNFNNFAIIELMTKGGPRNPADVAGQTDILISYTYRLAFGGVKGIDYGFASAITLFIFLIVAAVTVYNFRLSRRLENVYSNG